SISKDSLFNGSIKIIGPADTLIDSFACTGKPKQVVRIANGDIFIADEFSGLKQRYGKDNPTDDLAPRPEGPAKYSSFDIYAHNKEVWIAHGTVNDVWIFQNDGSGFSSFIDETWKSYSLYLFPPFGTNTYDFTNITKGPDGSIYAGSSQ